MLIIKKLVFSNFLVALCVLSLFQITSFLFDFYPSNELLILIFLCSFSCYNFMKINSNSIKNKSYKKDSFLKIVAILSSLTSVILILKLRLGVYFLPLIIIAIFYTFSIERLIKLISSRYLFSKKINYSFLKKTIRDIPFLKIFIIVFCWSYLTFLFPVIFFKVEFSFDVIIHFFIRLFFVFAITIPFDIRDIDFDKIHTIPSFLGIQKSKYVSYFSLFVCELLSLMLLLYKHINLSTFLAFYITFEISLLFIFFIKKNSKELYFSFYIEGVSILMFVLIYIANFVFKC